jgi:5-methylcytosine-specific restriction endonuclease McrA
VARESGKPASTVVYWVNKHGLISAHAARHAAKGGIERDVLGGLVEQGLSVRQIAAESGLSAGTVQHWLRQYGLRTQPARYRRRDAPPSSGLVRECSRHGWTAYVRSSTGTYRCTRCRIEAVSTRRRRVKEILVAEAGGCCVICGFDGYIGALQFHHVDPAEKRFALASRGLARAMEEVRAEAAKCILLCANCHAAVEGGAATIPADRPADNS